MRRFPFDLCFSEASVKRLRRIEIARPRADHVFENFREVPGMWNTGYVRRLSFGCDAIYIRFAKNLVEAGLPYLTAPHFDQRRVDFAPHGGKCHKVLAFLPPSRHQKE